MNVDEIVKQWRNAPFVRGSTDCCAFADFVAFKLTGRHYLPAYSSDDEAVAIVERYGSLSGAVTHFMERPPVPKEQLEPGDIVLIKVGPAEAVGVLMHGRAATVVEDGCCQDFPLRTVAHGWRLWA